MKKSRAIVVLLCILLLLAGISYVDIYGIDAAGTGSASDIKLGLDLAGGVSITYQVVGDEAPSSTDMNDTIAKLQKRVENYSKEAIVYQGDPTELISRFPASAMLTQFYRNWADPEHCILSHRQMRTATRTTPDRWCRQRAATDTPMC